MLTGETFEVIDSRSIPALWATINPAASAYERAIIIFPSFLSAIKKKKQCNLN